MGAKSKHLLDFTVREQDQTGLLNLIHCTGTSQDGLHFRNDTLQPICQTCRHSIFLTSELKLPVWS